MKDRPWPWEGGSYGDDSFPFNRMPASDTTSKLAASLHPLPIRTEAGTQQTLTELYRP